MSIIISQSLPVPPGLADGQIADANQITPLYDSLNAFNFPVDLVPFKTVLSDYTANAITVGGSDTIDYAISPSVNGLAFWISMVSFTWTAGNAPTLTYRFGGADSTTVALNNTASGGGLGIILSGPQGLANEYMGFQVSSGVVQAPFTFSVIPVANPLASVGFKVGGVAANMVIRAVRVIAQAF